jgi:hypothetical protein
LALLRLTPLSTTFISWRWALLVEETVIPWENHQPVASYEQTLSQNVVSSTPRRERVYNLQMFTLWRH